MTSFYGVALNLFAHTKAPIYRGLTMAILRKTLRPQTDPSTETDENRSQKERARYNKPRIPKHPSSASSEHPDTSEHAETSKYSDASETSEISDAFTPSAAAERIITAIEAQKKYPDRASIYLDGTFAFGLPRALVVQHMLCKGCRIDEEKQRMLLGEAQILRAKEITLNFLSYQPRTEQEVVNKLREREIPPEVIEQVLTRFRDLGYLNDEGFARSFAQSRLDGRGQGPRRIQMELKKRGVAEPHIREALSHLQEQNDLPEAILPHAQKRWERLRKEANPQKRKQKLLDFLLRQGVGFDIAQKVFQSLQKQDDDAPTHDAELDEFPFVEAETADAFDEPEPVERDALEEIRPLAIKRWHRLEKSDDNLQKRKRKLIDYLRRQGFAFDTISAVLEEIT